MKLENAGKQIGILRKKMKVSRNKLCKGLCSEAELRLIEKGEGKADVILLAALFERLGKSAERLTYILTAEEYQRICMRDEIEEALRFGRLADAKQFFGEYQERNPAGKDRILGMYEERIGGILALEEFCSGACGRDMSGKLEEAAAHFQAAIARTLDVNDLFDGKLGRQLCAGGRFLAMFEIENIMLYLHVQMQHDMREEQVRLLENICHYLEEKVEDEGLRAQFLAKAGMLLGEQYLAKGDYGTCVNLHERILELNRQNKLIVCVLPLLEQMITAYKKLENAEKAEIYTLHKENFEAVFRELPFSADCINKLYHTCRLRQYFLEGRLIAAERRWREMTQEELVDGIYENVENLSRVENGKANCDRIKFYSLMERLEMDKTRYDGNLVTDEYQVLELDQSIERHLAEGEYEEVGHELYQLEKSVDMSEKCNRQLVLGLKNREELRKKKIGTQEEIRRAKEEALERAKELLELTYHLENVEAEGQRYRRLPFRNEMYLFNQICLLLRATGRTAEAIEMSERMMRTYDMAVEKKKFHFRNVYLCATNLSRYLESVDRLSEAEGLADELIGQKFMLGKISLIHSGYATKFDIAEKRGERMKCGLEWLRRACFWSEWCGYEKDHGKLLRAWNEFKKQPDHKKCCIKPHGTR